MAFQKLSKRPEDSAFLKDITMLARMSDEKFDDEVIYWRGIRKLNGPIQIEVATMMLRGVLETTDLCRKSVELSPEKRAASANNLDYFCKAAIAGLALSQLLRRTPSRFIENAQTGWGQDVNVELDLSADAPRPVGRLHVGRHYLSKVLPAYEPDQPLTWYADETLAVRATYPANPGSYFKERYLGVTEQEFNTANYVTLYPRLLNSFVEMD